MMPDDMAAIATASNFDVKSPLTKDATVDNVKKNLKNAVRH